MRKMEYHDYTAYFITIKDIIVISYEVARFLIKDTCSGLQQYLDSHIDYTGDYNQVSLFKS